MIAIYPVDRPGRAARRSDDGVETVGLQRLVDAFLPRLPAIVGQCFQIGRFRQRPFFLRRQHPFLPKIGHDSGVGRVKSDYVGHGFHRRVWS